MPYETSDEVRSPFDRFSLANNGLSTSRGGSYDLGKLPQWCSGAARRRKRLSDGTGPASEPTIIGGPRSSALSRRAAQSRFTPGSARFTMRALPSSLTRSERVERHATTRFSRFGTGTGRRGAAGAGKHSFQSAGSRTNQRPRLLHARGSHASPTGNAAIRCLFVRRDGH